MTVIKTNGCKVEGDNEVMMLKINIGDDLQAQKIIMPDVINAEQPNENTVFVQFADGTKEVARCSPEDDFSFETGVLICVFKKLIGESVEMTNVTGSSVYNKIIKYAVSKKDATKKKRKQEIEREKESKREAAELRKKMNDNKRKDDEEQSRIIRNAIIDVINEIFTDSDAE